MNPSFKFEDVDVVTDRNNLKKLFNFASGRARDSFRIDLEMVQNTLFMTRRDRNTRSFIHMSKHPGFGHNFERAFTTSEPGLEDSTGHHRVLRYALGHLNCVVRFEVDACCKETRQGTRNMTRPSKRA